MNNLLEFVGIMALLEVASAAIAFVGLIAIGLYELLPRAPLRTSAGPPGPVTDRNCGDATVYRTRPQR